MQTTVTLASAVVEPRWYVIQCKRRQETRALEHLERQGFSCYLPKLVAEKLQQGRRGEVYEPLFPAYLFIHLDRVNDNWYPIRSTRGVIRIVGAFERPLPLQDEIVEIIRERLVSNQPRVPYLTPGERVRITDSCFSDVEAIFVANDGKERVMLLMNILHREQTLSFPLDSVRKARNPIASSVAAVQA